MQDIVDKLIEIAEIVDECNEDCEKCILNQKIYKGHSVLNGATLDISICNILEDLWFKLK